MDDTGASAKADQALAVPVEPVARLDPSGFDPSRYTDSLMVPDTFGGLLGEIARIANDYDLRERIEEYDDAIADSFIWRDCIELANAIAMEARQGGDGATRLHAEHNSAGLNEASPNPSRQDTSPSSKDET